MSLSAFAWPLSDGPGKFDLMLALFGEKELLSFTLKLKSGEPGSNIRDVAVRAVRRLDNDNYLIFGNWFVRPVVIYYTTKRSRGSSLGSFEFRSWTMS